MMLGQAHAQELGEHAAEAAGKFDAGKTIIEHVSNSSMEHPLFHLPTLLGIDFSVTKHVLMLWLVVGVRLRRDHRHGAPLPPAGPPDSGRLHERARGAGRVHPRHHRAPERRQEVGQYLDPAAAHLLRVHPVRERDRTDPGLRGVRPARSFRAAHQRRLVPQAVDARRHDRDRATST